MKKLIAFLFSAFLLPVALFAAVKDPDVVKGNFSGKITDAKTGAPVQGVSIYVSDIKAGATSNANGLFEINNLSEGNHLVEISHIGYNTIAEYVDIKGTTVKNYSLSGSVVENNAVVVTGVAKATQIKKIPFQIAVVRKEDLMQSASTNLIEALVKKSGISTISTGPAISKPVIRGLSYNRVLTINDGVRQEGQQWGDEHGIEIDEASVNKVEILKGPASIIYGSDALAGVINIITNVPVESNTIKANIGGNYQNNNRLKAYNGNIAGNKNGLNWNLYGSVKNAADYENKYDGKVFNSRFNEHNVGGYVGYNGSWGYSHLLASSFDLKAGLVEGERDSAGYFIKPLPGGIEERATDDDLKSYTTAIPYQHIRHFKVATDNSINIGKSRLTLNVGFQRNRREEFGNPDDLEERALFFDLKTITYTAQLHLKDMAGWRTSLGVNGMKQMNKNLGVEQLIPDYDLFDVGGFAYTQKSIKQITLSGGVRFDNRDLDAKNLMDGSSIKNNGFKKSFSNITGSAGITVQVTTKLNLKLNFARGFRAPGIPELASNGSHEGTNRYEFGDVNLKSETNFQTDAGVEFATEHFSFSASAFYNAFNNFIFYRKLEAALGGDSVINVDGSDLTAFKFDQQKAVLSGGEIMLDIHPHPLDWLHIENTFSFVRGRLDKAVEGSKDLPFMPAPKLNTEIRADFKKASKYIQNFYVKFEIDNTFKQDNIFTAYNTETATPGYTLLNAGVGFDFLNKKQQPLYTLSLSIINIADVAYQNHLSRLKYGPENLTTGRTGVYNMGRNVSLKLNVPLNFILKK